MPKPKILVISKYWKRVEVDLTDPNPALKTHCVICTSALFPEWRNLTGNCEISEDAVCAICWRCSRYGSDRKLRIKTVDQLQIERKEENKQRARERRKSYIPKKKRDKALARGQAMNKRPCGCSIKGRHKAGCEKAKDYKKKESKNG